jgi:apolipoprotein N-acyltransferase
MSNIAWFGDSVILDQHLEISRMRALELRRPMIRATNTGVSAIIDHTGRVDVKAKFFSKETIKGVVQGRFDRPSFFAWWASRYGLVPLWVLALLVLGTSWCQKILALKRLKQVQEKLEN